MVGTNARFPLVLHGLHKMEGLRTDSKVISLYFLKVRNVA
jgi:hypothetical protein